LKNAVNLFISLPSTAHYTANYGSESRSINHKAAE
jgi:hypothetical protein